MLLPDRLTYGSTLGITAPASPLDKELIDKKLCEFEDLGFKTLLGEHLYDSLGYLAGSDKYRASDFNFLYSRPEVAGIIPLRGGYGTMRMMPYIDYKSIYLKPKIICGYSDLTPLLNFIAEKLGIIAFHGPMVSSDLREDTTRDSFLHSLMRGYEPYSIKNSEGHAMWSSCDATLCGALAGGNLSLICASLGTPYEINFAGKILFLEEVGEKPYAIDRMLTTLILSGSLKQCLGIILGQFTDCQPSDYNKSLSMEQVLADRLLPLKKPILSGLMCGHDSPNMTLPIGAAIEMDCKHSTLHVLQAVVR